MQTRIAFNAGEIASDLAQRVDLDVYTRACSALENWHVTQTGAIERRHGMRYVSEALSEESCLYPYIYSYSDDGGRYLVEIAPAVVRVLNLNGTEAARFTSGEEALEFSFIPSRVRTKQVNALLYITSQDNWPMVLRLDEFGSWSFERVEFKQLPWRYDYEQRDNPVTVRCTPGNGEVSWDVEFADEETEDEADVEESDYLRASVWLDDAEATSRSQELRDGVQIVTQMPASCEAGERFAVHGESVVRYYICKKAFTADNYVSGLDEPSCYTDSFQEAENLSGFENVTPVFSVGSLGAISLNQKVAIKSGYWEYFTCIKGYSARPGSSTDFKDYPGYFIRGLAVGKALPCGGTWKFYCSGLWYGSYEVRRCYDTKALTGNWEPRGTSFSRIGSSSNTLVSGDEKDEECYLRLFLTRSKYMGETLDAGFPADACSNRLIVDGYKHDLVLWRKITHDENGDVLMSEWLCQDKVQVEWAAEQDILDWSWCAFSLRYGYPALVDMYNQRLVFASTYAQPQSFWLSRTDDLYNFQTGDGDDSALALTMATTSQNPICWMQAQSHRLLLGTSEAEWVLSAGQSQGGITPKNAQIEDHGHTGSNGIACLHAVDKALFIERGGGRVYEYGYSIEVDGYRGSDLTVLAPHIGNKHGGFRRSTLLRKPDTVAVFSLGDGSAACCTYNSHQEVKAWGRWLTNGTILDVCAMPDGDNADRLFLLVVRERRDNAGILLSRTAYIEMVGDDTGYLDNEENDYVSLVLTNALNNPLEQKVEKTPSYNVAFRLGAELDISEKGAVGFTADGERWTCPDRSLTLPEGWHELVPRPGWAYETKVGLRVRGERSCTLYAIQG